MIKLPELPYKRDGLAPHISKETLNFHYGKHHKGYVDNLNKLIKDTDYEDMDLEDIVKKSSGTIFNNAAQVWNHTFYWNCLTPKNKELDKDNELRIELEKQFDSLEGFKEQFVKRAKKLFGSGYCWLVSTAGSLEIRLHKDADTPLTEKNVVPLFTVDLWEHSYYIMHQNKREAYLNSIWNVINWKFISDNYIR